MTLINKAIIFNPYRCNATDGGPSGVIAQNILGHPSDTYYVNSVEEPVITRFNRLKSIIIPPPVHAKYNNKYMFCQQLFKKNNADKYKIIYFHDVYSLYFCASLINKNQRVILQVHSALFPHEEIRYASFATNEIVSFSKKVERNAFRKADYVVYPNKWIADSYSPLIHKNTKVLFLTTGVKQPSSIQKIPLDPKNIYLLYIGRRNEVKGYDILIEAFQKANYRRPELKLIILGPGDFKSGKGLIDLGFTNRPHDWMASCSFLVNCNRYNYLDMVVLEALSVGAGIIVSTAGGHKELSEEQSAGLTTIDEVSIENLFQIFMSIDVSDKKSKAKAENRALYKKKYSDIHYRANLESLLKDLLS